MPPSKRLKNKQQRSGQAKEETQGETRLLMLLLAAISTNNNNNNNNTSAPKSKEWENINIEFG